MIVWYSHFIGFDNMTKSVGALVSLLHTWSTYTSINTKHYFLNVRLFAAKKMFRTGTHGYDNDDPQMHALFMVSGPMFKKNFTAQPFDNVDLYPLISHLLALDETANYSRPVNGTIAGVEQLLLSPKSSSANTSSSLSLHVLAGTIATFIKALRKYQWP